MKCPYQTRTIHQPEVVNEHGRILAEDITIFGECLKNECPFYTVKYNLDGTCLKAYAEGGKT